MGLGGELLRPNGLANGDREVVAFVVQGARVVGDLGAEGDRPGVDDRVKLLLFWRSKAGAQCLNQGGEMGEAHLKSIKKIIKK
jgi:hypothetical protein